MTTNDLRWWRIAVDSRGAVLSCEAVERADSSGGAILYVQARTQAEAGRAAWNAYCKLAQRRRREALNADGKCAWCGRPNDRARDRRCLLCLGDERRRERNVRAVKRSELSEPLPTRATITPTKERLAVLFEVQRAWQAAETNHAFSRWLALELAQLGAGKAVA